MMVTQVQATILGKRRDWDQDNERGVEHHQGLRCVHESTEYIGSGGSIIYRRCTRCGAVLLVQGGRALAIPSR